MAAGPWREVRVYDADDLVHWIEQVPTVGLWLATRLEKRPEGTRELEEVWKEWSLATQWPLTEDLVLSDRDQSAAEVLLAPRRPLRPIAASHIVRRGGGIPPRHAWRASGRSRHGLPRTPPCGDHCSGGAGAGQRPCGTYPNLDRAGSWASAEPRQQGSLRAAGIRRRPHVARRSTHARATLAGKDLQRPAGRWHRQAPCRGACPRQRP